jgi:two-component system OmpR family response regulator
VDDAFSLALAHAPTPNSVAIGCRQLRPKADHLPTIRRARGLTLRGVDASLSESSSRGVADGAPYAGETALPPHILVVGHEGVLSEYLSENGYRVTSVPDETAMLETVQSTVVDLVVLPLSPQHDQGAQLVQRLRNESPVPIIVLSARRDEFDRIMALEVGADDCLTEPFSPRELLARVRAILRRRRIDSRQRKTQGPGAYRFGDWELNLNTRRLHSAARRQIGLSNGEFSVLVVLLGARGRTLSRMQILELSRLHDDEVYDRAVDMLVMRLRRKLEADTDAPRYLLTVRGAGYRIGVPVEPVY